MIKGVGVDICEIARIRAVYESQGQRFVKRLLGVQEQAIFQARFDGNAQRGIAYLASRFAAKEAFSKAYGAGIGQDFNFQDIQILNYASGQPYCELSERLKSQLSDARIHISLSDEKTSVVAFVVIEV
ncbi:MAG: holo-ACP synthase [Alcaligenaceae bacterium]|nr:holo-ACP synthase [Alcaligenaceae bacterium]